jgi:hypothetical protein
VDSVGDAVGAQVFLEDRAHRRQVEAGAVQVRVGQRDLRGEVALRGAYVDEAAVVPTSPRFQ